MDTINQVFTLFRVNYHNQYHAAFGDVTVLNQAKRLWKEALAPFSDEQILRAAREVIESSDYLPTLHRMLEACESALATEGLPPVAVAYREAANAPSPKNAQRWSHPAVYLAGREVGWNAMAHLPESRSFPLYAKAYRELIKKVLAGETLEIDRPPALEEKTGPLLTRETVSARIRDLKALFDDKPG
ncbi:MAG: replication protein P [Porticoccaceae bacterium]|nr:replication protein P [Porticoccaceae bacterium]MEA3301338.1 replication protein P [Pseudomonadota bacterium]